MLIVVGREFRLSLIRRPTNWGSHMLAGYSDGSPVRQPIQCGENILRGYWREETERFIAFRSHWKFQAEFCTPGAGHEKGGLEGKAGHFRRNHWVPIPVARHRAELTAQVLDDCRADEERKIGDRVQTRLAMALCVARCWQKKRPHFTTAEGLIKERVEAQHDNQPRRALAWSSRYELIASDEVGYVAAASLFQ